MQSGETLDSQLVNATPMSTQSEPQPVTEQGRVIECIFEAIGNRPGSVLLMWLGLNNFHGDMGTRSDLQRSRWTSMCGVV